MANERWDKPEYWEDLSEGNKKSHDEYSQILLEFFKDLRRKGKINIAFGKYATPDEEQDNKNFLKILQDQNKIYKATNMLIHALWSN